MITISDSSPLILLSKLNRLKLLKKLYTNILIPQEVYHEVVVRGKQEEYSDAFRIEMVIQDYIHIKRLNEEYTKRAEKLKSSLGSGESEAIMLALQEDADFFLADDSEVRKIAESEEIKCRSTLGILFQSLHEEIITLEEYEELIDKLSRFSWLSPEVVSKYLRSGYRRCKNEN